MNYISITVCDFLHDHTLMKAHKKAHSLQFLYLALYLKVIVEYYHYFSIKLKTLYCFNIKQLQ